jgi:arylsulfatase A-like enzyme
MKIIPRFLALSLLALPCLLLAAVTATAAPQPNIIFIMGDDIGWGDFQSYNPRGKVPSPNIDRLAREGMRFTDAHAPAALCAPTRYAVATGNYAWRGRLPGGTWGWNAAPQFLAGQKTVGHLLQGAGYRTGLFGKLHFGGEFQPLPSGGPDFTKPMKTGPIQWGFSYSYVLLGGHQGPPYMFFENNRVVGDAAKVLQLKAGPLNGGSVPVPGLGLPTWDSRKVGETLVNKVIAFIDGDKSKPFYVHLSTDGAHGPYTPPVTLRGTPIKGVTKMTAHTDMVFEVDVVIGKLFEALKARGLLEKTLIVVSSDNGGIPQERAFGHDAVGGLRGEKSFIFEGGHRVPFVAYWKGRVPAGTVRNQVIGTHDIVPTFVELAGGKFATDQMLDSVSLVPALLGTHGDSQPVRQTLLIDSGAGRDAFNDKPLPGVDWSEIAKKGAKSGSQGMSHALRQGAWKLVFDIQYNKPVALYNLAVDLAEKTNLIASPAQAARVTQMDKLYREIRASNRSTRAEFLVYP